MLIVLSREDVRIALEYLTHAAPSIPNKTLFAVQDRFRRALDAKPKQRGSFEWRGSLSTVLGD